MTIRDFPFKDGRYYCFQQKGWIAILDDDDIIVESVFKEAAKLAASNPDLGAILCNWQEMEEETGELIEREFQPICYADLCFSPTSCHQLALVNCQKIPPYLFEVGHDLEFLWDWLFTAGAIMNAGALHLFKVGYYWNQWKGQDHIVKQDMFLRNADIVRTTLNELMKEKKLQSFDTIKIVKDSK